MKRMDHIVVDVEIQKTIDQVKGGWDATDKLGVACAVVYEYLSDRYLIYMENDVKELRSRLLRADRITGYNIWKFDFPVIWALPGRERVRELESKTNDLLARIWKNLKLDPDDFSDNHKGWGLDNVAGGTIGQRKIGYGGDAPKWYQSGQLGRMLTYCADDVRLERDLGAFVDRYGYVVNGETGQVVPMATWPKEVR